MGSFQDITIDTIKQIANTPAKEIERRRINLWFYRSLYYELDTTIISDYEYDRKEYEYKLLREFYPKVKSRFSCPLLCVGTDMDDYTRLKVRSLIKYWKQHAELKKEQEIKTDKKGQVLLFGAQFVRCN